MQPGHVVRWNRAFFAMCSQEMFKNAFNSGYPRLPPVLVVPPPGLCLC
jgi:hypothetical protein